MILLTIVRFTRSPLQNNAMLGSNIIDSAGTPVQGNPTVQYTLKDIKSVVDQNFVQQLYSSSALTITPPGDNTGAYIVFGTSDIGTSADNVYYTTANSTFTFSQPGTYYIQLTYNTRGNGGNSPEFIFITKDSAGAQVGPTTLNKITRGVTADRVPVNIDIMLNVTSSSSYQFWVAQASGGTGALVVNAFATNWVDVPSAAITISKLI